MMLIIRKKDFWLNSAVISDLITGRDNMKKFKKLLIVIFIMLITVSYSAFAQEDMQDQFDAGYAAVDNVLRIFSNYSKDRFSAQVSHELEPIRSEFLNSVDNTAARQQYAEFEIYVDSVIVKEDLMSVEFKWYKKFKLYDNPDWQDAQGQSEFIFLLEDGNWKLRKANGDNPF
jgi:hypothetical protein